MQGRKNDKEQIQENIRQMERRHGIYRVVFTFATLLFIAGVSGVYFYRDGIKALMGFEIKTNVQEAVATDISGEELQESEAGSSIDDEALPEKSSKETEIYGRLFDIKEIKLVNTKNNVSSYTGQYLEVALTNETLENEDIKLIIWTIPDKDYYASYRHYPEWKWIMRKLIARSLWIEGEESFRYDIGNYGNFHVIVRQPDVERIDQDGKQVIHVFAYPKDIDFVDYESGT